MTDPTPTTVAVPVELIKMFDRGYPRVEDGRSSMVEELVALLPKPKPRLVAVELQGDYLDLPRDLSTLPDLLTLLDCVIEDWWNSTFSDDDDALKSRIRAALGVTE